MLQIEFVPFESGAVLTSVCCVSCEREDIISDHRDKQGCQINTTEQVPSAADLGQNELQTCCS